MTEYTRSKARQLRLPATSTPEDLTYNTNVTYGTYTLIVGYLYRPGDNGYFWAAYRNTGGIEDETNLEAVSDGFYEDDGHAIKAALEWVAQWG